MALGESGRPSAAVTNASDFDPIEAVAEELGSPLDAVGSESTVEEFEIGTHSNPGYSLCFISVKLH